VASTDKKAQERGVTVCHCRRPHHGGQYPTTAPLVEKSRSGGNGKKETRMTQPLFLCGGELKRGGSFLNGAFKKKFELSGQNWYLEEVQFISSSDSGIRLSIKEAGGHE